MLPALRTYGRREASLPRDLQMKKLTAWALLLAACGFVTSAPAAVSPQECLACHGPYEALQKKIENWTDEFGEKVQPHMWLDDKAANPHEGAKVPANCTGCHKEHPLPPPAGYKAEAPKSFSLCYGCHHMENFQKCGDAGCHEK